MTKSTNIQIAATIFQSVKAKANAFDADIINIVGMDFYETQYLYKPTNVPDYTHSKEHVDKLKYDFSVVFGYFDTIQFNIFTLANYNPNLENVNIL